jgi:hypothetical protein
MVGTREGRRRFGPKAALLFAALFGGPSSPDGRARATERDEGRETRAILRG